MGKFLVVCYSRSGHTKKIGQDISKQLGADFEEIIDTKNRKGIIGFIKSVRDAMKKTPAVLQPIKLNPADYETVIVGTPVWAATVANPVLTYLKEHSKEIKKAAFFFTSGGEQKEDFFKSVNEYLNKTPVATVGLTRVEVSKGDYSKKIRDFVGQLKK